MKRTEFSLELASPLRTADVEIRRREGWLVGVEVDGYRGVGEATPLPGWTEPPRACRDALDRADDQGVPARHDELLDLGRAPAARHALSLALADAKARREDESLATWLRSEYPDDADWTVPKTVPANATIGDGTVEETVDAAVRAVDAGYETLKLKVGARHYERDVERVGAVRAAVGDGVELRADANGAWDGYTAPAAVDALAEFDLAYVEQPLPADDLRGHRKLQGRGVDIALDESVLVHGVETVLAVGVADVVVLKPMSLGGPDRAREAAVKARRLGATPVVTTTVDAAVARAAAVHVAASVPDVPACGLATGDLLSEDLGSDPAPVENGRVRVPAGPGNAGDAFDGGLWGEEA